MALTNQHVNPETSEHIDARADFAGLLKELEKGDKSAPIPKEDPGEAFRFLYDGWVERGGFESGKRRHSVRQIKAWLGSDNEVRSLETKLAGKTWLQYEDALNLLNLFLERWTYNELGNQHSPYADGNMYELAKNFLDDLFVEDAKAILLPERARRSEAREGVRKSTTKSVSEPEIVDKTRPSEKTIQGLFGESEILVTISRARTIIGDSPPQAMSDFHGLMESLHKIYMNGKRKRALIWITDLGLRNDKVAARGAIYNVQFLATQFQSIAMIERKGREDLYSWLDENACIIVGSLTPTEIDLIYGRAGIELPKDRQGLHWFQSDRLFLESVPARWLDVPGSDSFGMSQRDLWRSPTITAHLRSEDWADLDHVPEVDEQKNLRYLYHGQVRKEIDGKEISDIRSIDLGEPGSRWSDAYRLAIQAALGRLDRRLEERVINIPPIYALAELRDQKFAVLRLSEFVHLHDLLIRKQQEATIN